MTIARASRVSLSQNRARCRASVVASSLTRRNDFCKRKTVYLQAIGVRITPCRVTRQRAVTATVREPYATMATTISEDVLACLSIARPTSYN
jgi:hypothetical protein